MSSIKKIRDDIETQLSIKDLVEVYEKMAANTMRRIRDAILVSREYYDNLARLSAEVGADLSSAEEIKNKRAALVLLSPDYGMYGEIVSKVFNSFLKTVQANTAADVYISGKIGQELIKTVAPGVEYQSLSLTGADDESLMATIGEKLWQYKQVEIFFGQFKSIARQEPNSRILSANQLESTRNQWAGEIVTKLKYLYEPSVEQVSNKLGKGIFVGVLEQTIKEDELAKNASRLMHLDKTLGQVEKNIAHGQARYHKANKRRLNKKQQLLLSGHKALIKIRKTYE